MTFREAQALAVERNDNLAYRKKIQRVKNTIVGALGGGLIGTAAGAIKDNTDTSLLKEVLGKSKNKGKVTGALLGSAGGGLLGYGLTRLKEKYDESAGLDPTLAHLIVTQYPYKYKKANAASSGELNKTAQFAEFGRLIGSGSALLGRGISKTMSGAGRGLSRLSNFTGKKLNRFMELLAGGKESTMKGYKELKSWVDRQLDVAKRTGSEADITRFTNLKDQIYNSFLEGSGGPFSVAGKVYTPTQEVSDELGKIIAARTLAGAGVAGGGYYAAKKYNEHKNKSWLAKLLGK